MTTVSIQERPLAHFPPLTVRMSKIGPTTLPPDSPSSRYTQNRRLSAAEGGDRSGIDRVKDISPSHSRELSTSSTESQKSSHVCLCQPEPKIPRPRNAFILYRQHHQAKIIAQHPGLSNPEVSKIIGEQWREEPENVKGEWKFLAEEEKARHQQQYPEYRYQPKRGRRGSFGEEGLASAGLSGDKLRCHKCGGRSIRTPSSPFTNSGLSTPTLPPPITPALSTPSTAGPIHSARGLPPMHPLQSPLIHREAFPTPIHTGPHGPHGPNPLIRGNYDMDGMLINHPMSPDAKRRRFNSGYASSPSHARQPGPGNQTPHPFPAHLRRESLPRIDQLMRRSPPTALMMPPPPRGSISRSRDDTNMHLPALQTPTTARAPSTNDQSRSVEAMVMSMPFWGKISILGKISPPLKPASPIGPAYRTRGALIAVEGDDSAAVQSLTGWLNNFLAREGDFYTRVEPGPQVPPADVKEVDLKDYLAVVAEWHVKNRDFVEFLTTSPPSRRPSDALNSPHASPSTASTTSPMSTTPTQASTSASQQHTPTQRDFQGGGKQQTPILLIPSYQVSTSNTYASHIPITDIYSPEDHWQWLATLWRGIIGPDLTIYVKDLSREELGKGTQSPAHEIKLVEVREDQRVVVVRRERDAVGEGAVSPRSAARANEAGERGKVEDAALRRLGFEVGEWVRGMTRNASGLSSAGRMDER